MKLWVFQVLPPATWEKLQCLPAICCDLGGSLTRDWRGSSSATCGYAGVGVRYLVIDEVSMVGVHTLQQSGLQCSVMALLWGPFPASPWQGELKCNCVSPRMCLWPWALLQTESEDSLVQCRAGAKQQNSSSRLHCYYNVSGFGRQPAHAAVVLAFSDTVAESAVAVHDYALKSRISNCRGGPAQHGTDWDDASRLFPRMLSRLTTMTGRWSSSNHCRGTGTCLSGWAWRDSLRGWFGQTETSQPVCILRSLISHTADVAR